MEVSGQLHIQAALPYEEEFRGGWAGSKASLGPMEKRKISCACWESYHGS
jgi:hypothetical protein